MHTQIHACTHANHMYNSLQRVPVNIYKEHWIHVVHQSLLLDPLLMLQGCKYTHSTAYVKLLKVIAITHYIT